MDISTHTSASKTGGSLIFVDERDKCDVMSRKPRLLRWCRRDDVDDGGDPPTQWDHLNPCHLDYFSKARKKKKKINSNSSLVLHIIELRVVCRWNENEWERMLLSHAHLRTYGQCYWKLQSQFLVSTGEKELNGGKKGVVAAKRTHNSQLESARIYIYGLLANIGEENSLCRFKLTHYWRRAQNEVVAVVSPTIPWLRNESRALKRRHFRAKSAGRDKWQSTDSFHVAFLFGHFSCIWGLKFPGIIQGDLIARTAWMDDDDDDDGQKERINELCLTCCARATLQFHH